MAFGSLRDMSQSLTILPVVASTRKSPQISRLVGLPSLSESGIVFFTTPWIDVAQQHATVSEQQAKEAFLAARELVDRGDQALREVRNYRGHVLDEESYGRRLERAKNSKQRNELIAGLRGLDRRALIRAPKPSVTQVNTGETGPRYNACMHARLAGMNVQ